MNTSCYKLERGLQRFLFILSTIMCLVFVTLGFNQAIERQHKLVWLFLTPAIMIVICAGIYQLNKKENIYIDIIFIFIIAFLPRYFLATTTWADPVNDFDLYYRTAVELANGNLDGIRSSTYTVNYPFLQAFVVFQTFLIKIFGDSIVTMRLIYSLINSMTCILLYLIGRRYDRRVGLFVGIISALYISNIVFTSVLTCQHISTFLYYLAFYILTIKTASSKKTFLKYLIVGIILGFAQLMRAIAPPILLAIIFFTIIKIAYRYKNDLDIKKNNSQKKMDVLSGLHLKIIIQKLYPILMLTVLLISYVLVQKSFDCYAYFKGYRDQISISTDIRFKIIIGLNYEGSGYSNSSELGKTFLMSDEEEKKQLLNNFIMGHVRNPQVFLEEVLLKKFEKQWAGIDASYRWLYGEQLKEIKEKMQNNEASDALIIRYGRCYMMQFYYNYIDYSYQIWVMLLAGIGFWVSRKVRHDNSLTLYTWIILGYVSVHIFIESQQRYRYFGMPIFFLFAAIGVVYIIDWISEKSLMLGGKNVKKIKS